jgi:hypothetical protein
MCFFRLNLETGQELIVPNYFSRRAKETQFNFAVFNLRHCAIALKHSGGASLQTRCDTLQTTF